MGKSKNKIKRNQFLIALGYTQGKYNVRYKKFKEFIDKEAKKRNIDNPFKLIDYFGGHYKEFLTLVKQYGVEFKPSKFPAIYKNSEMEKFTQELFKTRRPQSTGRKEGYETWKGKNVQYLIPVEEVFRLKGKDPKVYVSQLKNISLLLAMVQEQQYNKTDKEPVCEFSKVEYARRRGRTEEQIKKGGKIFEEDRRDLITGAITTYKIDHIEINGKKYTRYGIPNFYILDEPKNPRDNLRVSFYNEPYRTYVVDILYGEAKSYFKEDPKAIEDRYTDQHPYLFLFYLQLVKRKQSKSLLWWRVKTKDILEEMGVNKQILARPKECFKVLKECLIYFSEHYDPVPEIKSFRFNKVSQREKSDIQPLVLSISDGFKNISYREFKKLLKGMDIKDIREAYISIERYPKRYKKKLRSEMLDRTLKWFKGQITKIPKADQESIINMYIKKLGCNKYKGLFDYEANKVNANAVEFLTKVLPFELKRQKDQLKKQKPVKKQQGHIDNKELDYQEIIPKEIPENIKNAMEKLFNG